MGDLKVVYWAANKVEADLICGYFNEYGLPARQLQESLGKSLGLQFGLLGDIAIAVDESRVAEAEALLIDMEPPEETDEK